MAHDRPMGRTGTNRSRRRRQQQHRATHRTLALRRRAVGVERDFGRMAVAATGCRQIGRRGSAGDRAAHGISARRRIRIASRRTAARRSRPGRSRVDMAAGAEGVHRSSAPPHRAFARERCVCRTERRQQIDGEQPRSYDPFRTHVFVPYSVPTTDDRPLSASTVPARRTRPDAPSTPLHRAEPSPRPHRNARRAAAPHPRP